MCFWEIFLKNSRTTLEIIRMYCDFHLPPALEVQNEFNLFWLQRVALGRASTAFAVTAIVTRDLHALLEVFRKKIFWCNNNASFNYFHPHQIIITKLLCRNNVAMTWKSQSIFQRLLCLMRFSFFNSLKNLAIEVIFRCLEGIVLQCISALFWNCKYI